VSGKPCPLLNADSIPAPRSLPMEETPTENAIDDIEGQFNVDTMAGNLNAVQPEYKTKTTR